MPLNKHVMTTAFRQGLTKAYRDALLDAGLPADQAEIKPHIYGAATVKLNDDQLNTLRQHYGDKLVEMSGHGNSGAIEILLPAGEKYLSKNRPTLTDAEREARKSKGTGVRGVSAEERARREASRERMNALLKERFGIDLSENRADHPLDSGEEDTAADLSD